MDDASKRTLAADAAMAEGHGLQFRICRKARPRAPWELIHAGVTDLETAVLLAGAIAEHEVGILTDGPGRNVGMVYWTSREPELFNSTVITIQIH